MKNTVYLRSGLGLEPFFSGSETRGEMEAKEKMKEKTRRCV